MGKETLERFFTAKYLAIPSYQRDYAWEISNIDDLFEDILEALESNTSHYLGTVILSESDEKEKFWVVDGQQRLTTITMIINAMITEIADETQKIIFKDRYIKSQKTRLQLLGDNESFFEDLLSGFPLNPTTKSQVLLNSGYAHIKTRITSLINSTAYPIENLLNSLAKFEIMEFIESDEGKAIRIFQTVNDRGKSLTNLEKAKSLLMYYSNRFLNGSKDEKIKLAFGSIFKSFLKVKAISEEFGISTINSKIFTEDSVFRYHFLAYDNQKYDYKASSDYILEHFLKGHLKEIRISITDLEKFVSDYVDDLELFYHSFQNLIEKVKKIHYYKYFCNLEFSTILYPLLIRLESLNILDEVVPGKKYTFIELLEKVDFRVYKIRGTDPEVDMSILARDSRTLTKEEIRDQLFDFTTRFMSDSLFASYLERDVRYSALSHLFFEYDNYLRTSMPSRRNTWGLSEMYNINNDRKKTPTVEHIFPQTPRFSFPNLGFNSLEEYLIANNKLGNLLLLEKEINSACQNKNPSEKATNQNLYSKSDFTAVQETMAQILNANNSFTINDLSTRTESIKNFCLDHWKL
ncbi:DUF262 domain-containing protein [Leptospira paudalimensis]|uniref:DUF262 domain-containing protein n=1 Tax=Leptospira paudalimensis TaxID=2950024 RepID=A0ABT3MCI9_9LEPT|nr:DUF262 domain-containing protein [Leptospira paudalimensis]MCW7506100.1 DUF262 domain-containing protein [Leptospira paudalimensis]